MKKTIIKTALLIIAVALLLALAVWMVRTGFGVVQNLKYNNTEADPMFETPAEIVTRPPEMDEEEQIPEHNTLDDYVDDVQTPVDKTAEELAEEATANS